MPSEVSESYSVDGFIEFIDEAVPQDTSDVEPSGPSLSWTTSVDSLCWFEDDALNAEENAPT